MKNVVEILQSSSVIGSALRLLETASPESLVSHVMILVGQNSLACYVRHAEIPHCGSK